MKFPPALLGFSLIAPLLCSAASPQGEYPWLGDLDAAEALAKSSGKPILAVFR